MKSKRDSIFRKFVCRKGIRMKFEATFERRQRVTIEYEADSEQDAKNKLDDIFEDMEPVDFEDGYVAYDYALWNDTERKQVIEWSE